MLLKILMGLMVYLISFPINSIHLLRASISLNLYNQNSVARIICSDQVHEIKTFLGSSRPRFKKELPGYFYPCFVSVFATILPCECLLDHIYNYFVHTFLMIILIIHYMYLYLVLSRYRFHLDIIVKFNFYSTIASTFT